MYEVAKALREVNFNGVLIPDHIPQMGDDGRRRHSVYDRLYERTGEAGK